MARRGRLSDEGGDAAGVPDWKYRDVDDAACKCVVFNPRKLSSRDEWADAEFTTADWNVIANGCRYLLRKKGCKFGDFCEYCHVHPIHPKEPDYSQIITCLLYTSPSPRDRG